MIKFSNYSLCITLPKWIVSKLNWNKGEEVYVEILEDQGKLVISKSSVVSKKTKSDENSPTLRW